MSSSEKPKRNPILKRVAVSTERTSAATTTVMTETTPTRIFVEKKSSELVEDEAETKQRVNVREYSEEESEGNGKSLKDYFDEAEDMIKSSSGGGPPRWFSPLECGSHTRDSPLLLFLPGYGATVVPYHSCIQPLNALRLMKFTDIQRLETTVVRYHSCTTGIDGVGLGLIRQHQSLGKIFDIWCLHIPVKDRTSFTGLVKLIESTVRSESNRSPKRPVYLVGESLGACIALAVAARNPDIDLVLILVNPATSFNKSVLQSTIPLLELIPGQITTMLSSTLSLMTGDPLKMAMDNVAKRLSLQPTIQDLSQDLVALSSYLPVLADILPKETLLWKIELLKAASAYANSRLHAVKAQMLVLCSGKDQLMPSQEEGERLSSALHKCEPRNFYDHGHFLLLEDGVDLVTIIKGASYYRRGRSHDYVSDFMPPTSSEFNKICEDFRWMRVLSSPVMLSTLANGKIVRGLSGIPSEGPVLFVGYHNLLGLDVLTLIPEFMIESNILLRGLAHPMMYFKSKEGGLGDLSPYDVMRIMGAVPVSGINLYKLMSSKSHVLLYPGGVREALHRKGEEYKLFWPESSEFVRMATTFGAKIVPFGAVGEDDLAQIVLDYNDQMKIPYFKSQIEELTATAARLRTDTKGEVANQDMHMPYPVPKVPGRFYFYFGKPIETKGRKRELRDREKAHELYLEIKSEVEKCLAYLKEKRENDPYRNILPRLIYQATHGFTSQVPTFEP
ncbi:AB hydrolase-1 domain-containing protein [Citrus sinensis]|uniref:AB hydrolase-1 domain-containing protein n=1 Tax=Citrus sinensis TaxID=2711 RepID=A0ACB8N2W1_CITSI|nr:AB hydrolase-1 domain-containing protein [Citrus sinensis]